MLYPQKLHGIKGHAERTHLYSKITRFFDEKLKGDGAQSMPAQP